MLANNKCSPQAAAAVDALVEATGLGRSDALCLLSEPGFASRAGASSRAGWVGLAIEQTRALLYQTGLLHS